MKFSKIKKLCNPAKIYLLLSAIFIVFSGEIKLLSLIFVGIWTLILNYFCKKAGPVVSYVLVLFPFFILWVLFSLKKREGLCTECYGSNTCWDYGARHCNCANGYQWNSSGWGCFQPHADYESVDAPAPAPPPPPPPPTQAEIDREAAAKAKQDKIDKEIERVKAEIAKGAASDLAYCKSTVIPDYNKFKNILNEAVRGRDLAIQNMKKDKTLNNYNISKSEYDSHSATIKTAVEQLQSFYINSNCAGLGNWPKDPKPNLQVPPPPSS
jgi:hypothetical protein